MAYCELRLSANNVIHKMNSVNIILPETDTPGPYPVLYLLHGLSDDNTGWTRRTSLERYVENLPLIVVMPDGGRYWYTDSEKLDNIKYETFITQDLIDIIDRTFPTIKDRSGRAIAGLSMGGYGAMKLSLKHPELYCATVSFSGALNFAYNLQKNPQPEFMPIFGDKPVDGPNDIFSLIKKIDNEPAVANIPDLYVDCGSEDFLIEDNRSFHALLDRLNIEHIYKEYPGVHDWAYWDRGILEALPWIMQKLNSNNTE